MRLGDLDEAKKKLFSYYSFVNENTHKSNYMGETLMSYEVADMIDDCMDNTPTIDPETLPIVRELRSRNKRLKAVVKVQLEQLREKTSVIDELCEKVANLDEKLQRVTMERDAAVSEIESIIAYGLHLPNTCPFCKNEQCKMRGGTEPCMPKWRGIQEVQEDEQL